MIKSLLLSSALAALCMYSSETMAASPGPFVYFVNDSTINNSNLPAGVSVISEFSKNDRAALATAGRIVGFTTSFNDSDGSSIKWTDVNSGITTGPNTLQKLFNDPATASLSQQQLATAIFNIAGVDVGNSDDFPSNAEATANSQGGYVFYGQDIENNVGDGNTNGAAAYTAIFWAARVLLPTMKIIPVPASAVQKMTAAEWSIKDVVQGTANDNYLKILNLTSTLTSQQQTDVAANKVDLLSFLHIVKYNSSPLINGILAQQYSCQPNSSGTPCKQVNPGALPGSFSGDTPIFYDTTLSFALMSAHDDPPQLFITSTNPALNPPWKSYYMNKNQDLPFQAGVYWSEPSSSSDYSNFQAIKYLIPTSAISMSAARSPSGLRQNNNKLTIKVVGGTLGQVYNKKYKINCKATCSLYINPRRNGDSRIITLTARANSGSSFGGWYNGANRNKYLQIPVTNNVTVTAKFQ